MHKPRSQSELTRKELDQEKIRGKIIELAVTYGRSE